MTGKCRWRMTFLGRQAQITNLQNHPEAEQQQQQQGQLQADILAGEEMTVIFCPLQLDVSTAPPPPPPPPPPGGGGRAD